VGSNLKRPTPREIKNRDTFSAPSIRLGIQIGIQKVVLVD
jgi:hypothetical protein